MRIDNPKVELLLRNTARFLNKNVLIAGDIDSSAILHLVKDMGRCTLLTDSFYLYRSLTSACGLETDGELYNCAAGYKHLTIYFASPSFCASKTKDNVFDSVILFLSKSKDYCRKILKSFESSFSPATEIFIVGENASGGKSCDKIIASTNTVYKTDSARKCTLFETLYKDPFSFDLDEKTIDLAFNSRELKLRQDINVFSHGSVDEGTALLLEALDDIELYGQVHDIGCGCGIIGLYAAAKNDSIHVTLSDISACALECSAFNAQLNSLHDRVTVKPYCLGDEILPCDFILSNPPFHDGVKTIAQRTNQALTDLHRALKTGGSAVIVYNSFLDYKKTLAQTFSKILLLKKTSRFSVIQAFK